MTGSWSGRRSGTSAFHPLRTLACNAIHGRMATSFLLSNALASLALANATPVNSANDACTQAKARFAALDNFPLSRIGSCDVIPAANSPRGLYVLNLQSTRQCEGICSTLLGWFAVERKSGRVFDWKVGEWELGPEVRSRRSPLSTHCGR